MNSVRRFLHLMTLSFLFVQLILLQNLNAAEICTNVLKPVKYAMRSGDDFYSILKNFNLDPVIGEGGSLERLQVINKMVNQTSVESGTEILLPFKCEEQIVGWRVIDKGEYRIITSEKIEKIDPNANKVKTENIGPDGKTTDILNKAMPGLNDVDLDKVDDQNTDVSEALRYRMICDGEWTGTECITRYSALYVTGGAWYNRYDGVDRTTGGTGILLSKLNPEVGFGWINYWNNNFRTDLGFSILNNDIQPEVRSVPIDQGKKTINTLVADARYEVGKFAVKAGLSQRERLFYIFLPDNIFLIDDGGVVVNAVPILDFHVGVAYMFYQAGKLRVDTAATFVSMQAANTSAYAVKPGSAIEFELSVTHDRVKEFIFGTLKYEQSQQDTSILIQKASELGFKFGYAWKLKDW